VNKRLTKSTYLLEKLALFYHAIAAQSSNLVCYFQTLFVTSTMLWAHLLKK